MMPDDRERILGLFTDRLCGELGEREAAELKTCLARHPELAGEIERLETAWKALELLDTARAPGGQEHDALTRRLFERLNSENQLSDEDVEMLAAAGRKDDLKIRWIPGGNDPHAGSSE